jgi:hypothetical protein
MFLSTVSRDGCFLDIVRKDIRALGLIVPAMFGPPSPPATSAVTPAAGKRHRLQKEVTDSLWYFHLRWLFGFPAMARHGLCWTETAPYPNIVKLQNMLH